MIRSISNSPSFGSKILFNQTLYKGFSQAVIDSRTGGVGSDIANQFANAIKYIQNDGYDDTYSVETRNRGYEPQQRCYLLKNGEVVRSVDTFKLGANVMEAVIEEAESYSEESMDNPAPEIDAKTIKNKVEEVQKNLDELNKMVGGIETLTPRVNNAQRSMNNMLKELETKKTKQMLSTTRGESVVKKLNDIIADKHFGEMI